MEAPPEASPNLPATVRTLLNDERGYKRLAQVTGIKYKVVLGEVKHESREMTIPNAIAYAAAFGVTIVDLINGTAPEIVAARPIRRAA